MADQPGGFKRTQARLMCETGAGMDETLFIYMMAEQCCIPEPPAIIPLPSGKPEPRRAGRETERGGGRPGILQ